MTCKDCIHYNVCENHAQELRSEGYRVGFNSRSDAEKACVEFIQKSEWISIDERLPEDTIPDDYKYNTIKVLVAIKGKNGVTIRTQQRFLDYIYRDDKRSAFWTWRFSGGDVTHWMPLPEHPKKGGDE